MEVGDRFGRLMVIGWRMVVREDGRHRSQARVLCGCGSPPKWVWTKYLKSGTTRSCGCARLEAITTHGESSGDRRHQLYNTWTHMRARCRNFEDPNYGGKGIKVWGEWLDWPVFKDWALSHGWQEGLELDRVDPDGPYSPENCRWIVQRTNAKRARAIWDPDFSAQVAQYASDHNLTPWGLITLAVERLIEPE